MNNSEKSFSFTYLPLVIRLKCEETGELPMFLGSTLRGVLGWTLLKAKSDIYTYLFDAGTEQKTTTHLVKPYFINPPRPKNIYYQGEELQFTLSLFGNASIYASELVRALVEQKTFKLGAKRISFSLLSIVQEQTFQHIWDEQTNNIHLRNLSVVTIMPEQQLADWVSIQFQTPLRMRRQGKLITDLDFLTIIRNITMRTNELTERYGGSVNHEEINKLCEWAKEIQRTSSSIRCYEMKRYSNKTNEKMDFTGILGTVTFEGNLTPFTSWLNIARLLHIGRNTTFGCGRIELVIL